MKLLSLIALLALGCQSPNMPSVDTFDAPALLHSYDFVDPQGPPTVVVPVLCTYRVDTKAVVRCAP